MAENITIIRLLTGEEVIAEVTKRTDKEIHVKNALRIIVVPSSIPNDKTPSVAFSPFMQWSEDKEHVFKTDHVLMTAAPVKEFINQYNSLFGGIVVPTTKIIT